MPNQFKTTEGKIQVTIVSNRLNPIGQFTTSFCVVRPMPDIQCDFSVTYCNHWKAHWKGLDVGHRGLGNSYTKRERYKIFKILLEPVSDVLELFSCASVRENTIGSMKNAALHGADMVEFDVQVKEIKIA
jgi:glycerophosphocholine phosphodiesterase GPCPD1